MTTATVRPATYGCDPSIFKFSVTRYQRMIELGIVTAEDHFELLENYLVLKMPRTPRHDSTIQRMLDPLYAFRPFAWNLRIQSAIALADSQPEPDFAFVRGSAADYERRYPSPADIGLLIQVADSSLLRDQRDKTRIYARAGIVCYWIINLVDQRIEVYTQPSGPTAVPTYGSLQTHQPSDSIPLILDGVTVGTIAVADLLP